MLQTCPSKTQRCWNSSLSANGSSNVDDLDDQIVSKKFALDQLTRQYTQLTEKLRFVEGINTDALQANERRYHRLLGQQQETITKLQHNVSLLNNYITLLESELWGCQPKELNPSFDIKGQPGSYRGKQQGRDLLDLPSEL